MRDPLFRGENGVALAVPDPSAKISVVVHVLYLGGPGRKTPYMSTSESQEVAEYFAGPSGSVWQTSVSVARAEGARHLSRKQLLQDLRGRGRGRAKWHDVWEVRQAAAYIEQWSEHLLDWGMVGSAAVSSAVLRAFSTRHR